MMPTCMKRMGQLHVMAVGDEDTHREGHGDVAERNKSEHIRSTNGDGGKTDLRSANNTEKNQSKFGKKLKLNCALEMRGPRRRS